MKVSGRDRNAKAKTTGCVEVIGYFSNKPGIERVYKHVLANILRSLFVARTPSEEARSPGRRSNVENAPVEGQSPASQPRPLPIYGAQF